MNERDGAAFDPHLPNFARVMNYLAGGKDNYAVDRVVGDELLRIAPDVPRVAAELRGFVSRAVTFLAREGLRQFVDVGCGLPAPGSVHEVLNDLGVNARVVYVDDDPVVTVHGRAIVATRGGTGTAEGVVVRAVQADPRDPDAMLDHPELAQVVDLRRPTVILLRAQLGVYDDEVARRVTERLIDRLAPGSYLVVGHVIRSPCEEPTEEIVRLFTKNNLIDGENRHVRSLAQVARLLDGLDLVPPGLVPLPEWRPHPGEARFGPETFSVAGAVGRKNTSPPL